jgi:hypothetical protein
MTQRTIDVEQFIKTLVEDIFTNGQAQKAERLEMIDNQGRGIGGWGKDPFISRIHKALDSSERE